ncbi:MAG: hypothetical protein LLG93_07865 [Deltaproteobacteria bacterium]|nr:hypothetical protein [Deltaproteobacteria bacterium]
MSVEVPIPIIALAVLIVLVLALWRLSGGRYGQLRPSREVLDAYRSFRVDPDKGYYTSGPDAWPHAVMGLDRSWVLESDLWKRRDLDDRGMKALIEGMQARAMERLAPLEGFEIFDDRGAVIGDWLSVPGLNIVIRIIGDRRVGITTPPIDAGSQG